MNKKHKIIIGIIVFVVLVIGIIAFYIAKQRPAELANPASVYCENHNGILEIRSTIHGQYGICKFDNGTECEEWAFMRGLCNAGIYTTTPDKACTMEYAPVCGVNKITYGNICMADNVPIVLDGECPDCSLGCADYSPASSDFCTEGTIVYPGKDICGCYGHPVCVNE